MKKRAPAAAKPAEPNPLWQYTPPRVSRDGRVVEIDAMQLPMVLEHYAQAGVELVHTRRPR